MIVEEDEEEEDEVGEDEDAEDEEDDFEDVEEHSLSENPTQVTVAVAVSPRELME